MKDFKELVDVLVEVYGVESYLDNPADCVESEDDLWVACPACSEPVYAGDWEFKDMIYRRGIAFICPCCGELSELK